MEINTILLAIFIGISISRGWQIFVLRKDIKLLGHDLTRYRRDLSADVSEINREMLALKLRTLSERDMDSLLNDVSNIKHKVTEIPKLDSKLNHIERTSPNLILDKWKSEKVYFIKVLSSSGEKQIKCTFLNSTVNEEGEVILHVLQESEGKEGNYFNIVDVKHSEIISYS